MYSSKNVQKKFEVALILILLLLSVSFAEEKTTPEDTSDQSFTSQLDGPLLFIKRYSYTGIHIYDTFYKWPVKDKGNGDGIGGIYILENPSAPRDQWKIRTVIDGRTEGGLGNGVYSHPDISYDCSKIIFCYKATAAGCTMIYEIDIDGGNLRRLTDPTSCLAKYKGVKSGIHDLSPTYLPDGRIVFLSTRPAGLVPCANEGVSILHVMNGDGSDIHPISVNSETEFDPMVLPDGRIVFGRWEYIDKTALTVQSLWTIYPDGSNGTAMYGNNMVFPEAILDPRPVPGTGLIAATMTKHNAPPRGTVVMIDPFVGKNDPAAIFNFENKDNPTHDRGNSCEPYPLSKDVVIYSGRTKGAKRNSIMMINRKGERTTLLSDANISLHAPMLVRPRSARTLPEFTDRSKTTGTFYVQNVYDGLKGVKPGEAKWLRVIEESSRVSASPGSNIFNQTFSISAALAFSAKIYHGMVPIHEDGSAYFKAPSGRLIFFQVLDKDKRLIQSMRTFIQAAPGTTRSCIGCHEKKTNAPTSLKPIPNTLALKNPPSAPQPESWGSGYMDYSTLIQPIWDKNCVSCHGGEKKFAGRLDLTGGWTEFFSNSYENLVDRRHTQLVPYYIAGIDCMNGTAHYSVPLFPPKSFGSAVAPLAKVIASGHKNRIKDLTDIDRDLIMAWIDSNGLYFGTWDYTKFGPRLSAWVQTREKLTQTMDKAKCYSCHDKHFGGDWINLRKPEFSRILRAPLAKGKKGMGLAICQNHKTDPKRNRINLLRGGYQHAVKDLSFYAEKPVPALQEGGTDSPTFASTDEALWQEMLTIIRDGRKMALEQARVDMPGAELIAGKNRMMVPPPVPDQGPALKANADQAGVVSLQWKRPASIIGLTYEVHRWDKENFSPDETTLIAQTELPKIIDKTPPVGTNYYALVVAGKDKRSRPSRTKVTVKALPLAAVTLTDLGSQVKLDNGIVSAAWNKSNGRLTSLTQGSVELLGNGGSGYVLGVCNNKKINTKGTAYSLVRDTDELKEISFKRVARSAFPMTFDLRFVMRSGDSGIYVYQVLEHDVDDGLAKLSHFRDAYRLDPNIFSRVYIEDGRVFDEPEPARLAVAIPQTPKEGIKLTDGSIYYKYLRSNYLKDADVYGWAGGGRGAWMVRPSREFVNGGPTKQHICAHQTDTTPVMITHAISGHYGSGQIKLDSTDRAWKKIIGPYMIYLNKAADPDKAWADAKAKLKTEENNWPYDWMSHPNYTLAAKRGTITGKLNITDGSSIAGALVILAQPTDGTADTNWQRQGKDYIFWTKAAADGSFTIEKIRAGKYTLYSNVSGVLDEYELDGVNVKAGAVNTLGQLNWTPRKHGKLIWQIGTADRSAAEYLHGDDFRRFGLWFEYPKDFPNGVTYTIGKSNPATDWNYNQWCVKNSSGGYDLSPWTIRFDMDEITGDQAVLTVAIAAASGKGRLKVLVNGVEVLKDKSLLHDSAGIRAGIRGLYREKIIKFDSSILSTTSTNKIVLMQTRAGLFPSIMYDCIRLEVGADKNSK